MSFAKHVGEITKSMGYKLSTSHTTLHMPELALELGAPTNNDTKHNESHHKVDKKTDGRTSKKHDTFDVDVPHKSVEKIAVELGEQEIHHNLVPWNYWRRASFLPKPVPESFPPELTGPSIVYEYNLYHQAWRGKVLSKMIGKDKYKYDDNTADTIFQSAKKIRQCDEQFTAFKAHGTLKLYSPGTPNTPQLFHAMPHSKGKAWNDWAMFDLSDPSSPTPQANDFVAVQIKCFLDFRHLKQVNGMARPPGICAIIEPTAPNANSDEKYWSRLMVAIHKKPSIHEGSPEHFNQKRLASIERLRLPATVVPDLGNSNKRLHLRVVPRDTWGDLHDEWLTLRHETHFST